MHNRFHIAILALAAGSGLLGCYDAGADVPEMTASGKQQLAGPDIFVVNDERPEVVGIPGCTATLIHPNFVITGAHCGHSGPRMAAGQYAEFHIPGQATTTKITLDQAVQISAIASGLRDTSGYRWGTDTLLLHLMTPAPAGVTPAVIASWSPAQGDTSTTYGYGTYGDVTGCQDLYDGQKRRHTWTFPPSGKFGNGACGGDSGGPSFFGAAPGGDLFATTITGDGLNNLPQASEEILEQMRLMQPGKENWVWGADRGGSDLPNMPLVAASPSACESACITNDQCKSWTWGTNACYLKSAVPRWLPAATGTATGLRPTVERGYKRLVNGAIFIATAQTARACRQLCTARSGCRSFTFDSAARTCTGNSSIPTAVPQASGENMTSGIVAGSDSMLRYGNAYVTEALATADACRSACATDYFCQSYSYDSGTCSRIVGPGNPASSTTAKSGFKRRPSLPGVRFIGTTIGTLEHTLAPQSGSTYVPPDACVSECVSTTGCIAYTIKHHVPGDYLRCTLYSNVALETAIVDGDDPEIGLTRQVTSGYISELFN